jgi:site-specific recombinase XerD
MQSNKTCNLLEQYLSYLSIIKGRSDNTIKEYRTDILMFFIFLSKSKSISVVDIDFSWADADFLRSISLNDMYSFITYCQEQFHASPGTRARKIVSIRQFWKYLKTKANIIDNNVAEGLETPKQTKRIPKYLNLEESVRLLMECKESARDHCIITLLLNCALRLSELASLNIDQVSNDTIRIVGKGNKERKIFLTPAAKRAVFNWLKIRKP